MGGGSKCKCTLQNLGKLKMRGSVVDSFYF